MLQYEQNKEKNLQGEAINRQLAKQIKDKDEEKKENKFLKKIKTLFAGEQEEEDEF